MTQITLTVELGARRYPIFIGPQLLGQAHLLRPHIPGHQVMIVTNETVGPLYLELLRQGLSGLDVHVCVLPDGEEYKNLTTLDTIFNALLAVPCNRQTSVLALGGGVVGDMAGFAAACYQRGVPYVQVPTTLLAQVDSSVGGKTAVNHRLGKNMIGAFYQPRAVIADTDTLNSLDDRQLRAGIAEVVKYGLIRDPEFFAWLEHNLSGLLNRDPDAVAFAVERCCRNKAEVVAADEHERGKRALLNLGHTFGHAIETAVGYGRCLHGEAVATGMQMAAFLSQRLGDLSATDYERVVKLIGRTGLPGCPPSGITRSQFLRLMQADKKVVHGNIRLILLRTIGQAYVCQDYPRSRLEETLSQFGITS